MWLERREEENYPLGLCEGAQISKDKGDKGGKKKGKGKGGKEEPSGVKNNGASDDVIACVGGDFVLEIGCEELPPGDLDHAV